MPPPPLVLSDTRDPREHFKVRRSSFRLGLWYFLGPIRSRVRVFNLSRNGAPGLLLLPLIFLSLQYINLDLSLHASARLQSAPETRKCTQLQTARPGRSRIRGMNCTCADYQQLAIQQRSYNKPVVAANRLLKLADDPHAKHCNGNNS